jgi:L-iditol 2-dehydrogenase
MRAALLYGIHDLRVVNTPEPVVGAGEVLLRVHACGVCPTDLRKFHTGDDGKLTLPMNLGHEYVGTVVEIGANVQNFKAGMRVMGDGYGGYGEYALLDLKLEASAHVPVPLAVPVSVSDAAATFIEPLADCIHAIKDQATVQKGQTILIIGGGTMGQLLLMVAKEAGGRTFLSELDAGRRNMALSLGADKVIDPQVENVAETIRQLNSNQLADATILTIGVPALVQSALETVRPHGRLVLFGGFPRPARIEISLMFSIFAARSNL